VGVRTYGGRVKPDVRTDFKTVKATAKFLCRYCIAYSIKTNPNGIVPTVSNVIMRQGTATTDE
jgi:hypothetical protein